MALKKRLMENYFKERGSVRISTKLKNKSSEYSHNRVFDEPESLTKLTSVLERNLGQTEDKVETQLRTNLGQTKDKVETQLNVSSTKII